MTQRAIDGYYVYFVTTIVSQRRRFFVRAERASEIGSIIRVACRMNHFELFAYCILPDHVHLLVRKTPRALEKARYGKTPESSQRRLSSRRDNYRIGGLMQSIKGNFSRQQWPGRFWQPRFNFRIIDNKNRFMNTVDYIQYNSQKHGLNNSYSQKPWVWIDWNTMNDFFER